MYLCVCICVHMQTCACSFVHEFKYTHYSVHVEVRGQLPGVFLSTVWILGTKLSSSGLGTRGLTHRVISQIQHNHLGGIQTFTPGQMIWCMEVIWEPGLSPTVHHTWTFYSGHIWHKSQSNKAAFILEEKMSWMAFNSQDKSQSS